VLIACLFLLGGKAINERLSDIATFFFVASYLSGFAALIRLRKKEPNLERPYRVWAYPVLPMGLLVISSLFLAGTLLTNQASIPYVIGFIAISYGVYLKFLKTR
jgi:APA family basic amino acid/polyamine antiporter